MFIFESNLNQSCVIISKWHVIKNPLYFSVIIYFYILSINNYKRWYLILAEIWYFVCSNLSSWQSVDSVLELSYLHSLPLSASVRLLSAITQTWSHFLRTIARPQYGQTFAHTHTLSIVLCTWLSLAIYSWNATLNQNLCMYFSTIHKFRGNTYIYFKQQFSYI